MIQKLKCVTGYFNVKFDKNWLKNDSHPFGAIN